MELLSSPASDEMMHRIFATLALNLTKEDIFLRDEIAIFAVQMEMKLRENDHKPGWKDNSPSILMFRLTDELNELHDAIYHGGPPSLIRAEAVDVANFAMMISDVSK